MIDVGARVRALLHTDVAGTQNLAGGCVGDVRRLKLADGRNIVAKVGTGVAPGLALEGFMLEYLAEYTALPVPRVLWADDHLLLMNYVESDGVLNDTAQEDAAQHLAALHGVTAARFGFSCATVIGGLPQPNVQQESWVAFFRDQRLMHMGRSAREAGRLPREVFARLERLCGRLERWIDDSATPALIHGDMWGGNILARDGRIAAFIDPAITYADPEIELAFSTLFGTFGEAFFRRYGELRPLRPGFFEERRALYNLYPLLVHVRLFGGSYVGDVDRTLRTFGF